MLRRAAYRWRAEIEYGSRVLSFLGTQLESQNNHDIYSFSAKTNLIITLSIVCSVDARYNAAAYSCSNLWEKQR